jgi:hypothetical protein
VDAEESGLEISVADILKAFELAGSHFSNKGTCRDKLESRKQVALDLIDWAVEECDRGKKLLEAESELAILRSKKDGGTTYIAGPFGLG